MPDERSSANRIGFAIRAIDRLQPRASHRAHRLRFGYRPDLARRLPEVQARRCLEIIFAALAEAGAAPKDVVRTRMFLTDPADADAVGRAHGAAFGEVRPAATMLVIRGMLDPRWKVEIEADAVID